MTPRPHRRRCRSFTAPHAGEMATHMLELYKLLPAVNLFAARYMVTFCRCCQQWTILELDSTGRETVLREIAEA